MSGDEDRRQPAPANANRADVTAFGAAGAGDLVDDAPLPTSSAVTLKAAHDVFTRWLGECYDLGALDAVLAAAAVNRLGGDPAWLLVVSGSGNAKTETVGALAGAGAFITSTITSEGALLSAVGKKDQAADATGGLLRKIGDAGILVIKDFTSILSMSREVRAGVLAALREIYDGRWERNVGTDGGRTLTWTGRVVLIGAVTTAYDAAHAVISSMGDRFALVRTDSNSSAGRLAAGKQALANVDQEAEMRAALTAAVAAVYTGAEPELAELSDDDRAVLLDISNLVTLARTAVERDFRGEVVNAHASEMPTRFAKMLGQIVRGGLAVGMTAEDARAAAVRVAGDSMPPLRLLILDDLCRHPHSRTADVQKRVQKPRSTVDRELQALHILGLLSQHSSGSGLGAVWTYTLSAEVDVSALSVLVAGRQPTATRNVSTGAEGSPGMSVTVRGGHQECQ